jgi:hypothetical protein
MLDHSVVLMCRYALSTACSSASAAEETLLGVAPLAGDAVAAAQLASHVQRATTCA